MKTAVVKSSTLQASGRWDAKYNIALAEYLEQNGLAETPENVAAAMDAIKARDTAAKTAAQNLRKEAGNLVAQARELEESAELTYPLRHRP